MQFISIMGWVLFALIVIPIMIGLIMAIPDMIRYMRLRRM